MAARTVPAAANMKTPMLRQSTHMPAIGFASHTPFMLTKRKKLLEKWTRYLLRQINKYQQLKCCRYLNATQPAPMVPLASVRRRHTHACGTSDGEHAGRIVQNGQQKIY